MPYSTILNTGDGRLVSLGELKVPSKAKELAISHSKSSPTKDKKDSPQRLESASEIQAKTLASAAAKIMWRLNRNDQSDILVHKLITQNGGSLKGIETILHIRSFLARIGLDGDVKNIEYTSPKTGSAKRKGGKITREKSKYEDILGTISCDVDLRFCVDSLRKGEIFVPLYEALKKRHSQQPIEVGNLVLIPPNLKPLSESEFGDAVEAGKIILPKDWGFRKEENLLEIPLTGGQYSVTPSLELDLKGGDWDQMLTLGKRFLAQMQPRFPAAANFLDNPFDVRGIQISAGEREVKLVLDLNTSHPEVWQTLSQFLDLPVLPQGQTAAISEERHIEYRVARPNISAIQARPLARVFMPRTRLTVATEMSEKNTRASTTNVDLTLEKAIQTQEVVEFIRLLDSKSGEVDGLIRGIIINGKKAHILPFDARSSLKSWAKVAARQGNAMDERPLKKVDADFQNTVANHPGLKLLMASFVNRTFHNKTNLLISKEIQSPDVMRTLAVGEGAGIGTFISTSLYRVSLQTDLVEKSRLGVREIEDYRHLCSEGIANIYWLPEEGQIRKMVGPSFVEISLESFYKNMDFVLSVYLSHKGNDELRQQFMRQIEPFLSELDSLGLNIGIACGGTKGLMRELLMASSNRNYIQPIEISTLKDENSSDFQPKISVIGANDSTYNQAILAKISDARMSLNGGIGTSAATINDLLYQTRGDLTSAPIGVIDLTKRGGWNAFNQHLDTLTLGNDLAPSWLNHMLIRSNSMKGFFTEGLRPYLNGPLRWMNEKSIPPAVQFAGLQSHINNSRFFGKAPSSFLNGAMKHYNINLNSE